MSSHSATIGERMAVAIAREIEDEDLLLEGIGTFLPTAAYMLAQATTAPNSLRLCPVGNALATNASQISCFDYEFAILRQSLYHFDYQEVNTAYLPTYLPKGRWKEFLRPAQVDATGRTNNVVIGDHARPKVRLPGAAGLPDGVPLEPRVYMYIPRHSRQTLVEKLDFTSAPGSQEGGRPFRIISNLGIMGYDSEGQTQVEALFPGVTPEEIAAETGFPLKFAAELRPAPEPEPEELELLRNRIDPLNLRELEFLTGSERLSFLEAVIRKESGFESLRGQFETIAARLASPE